MDDVTLLLVDLNPRVVDAWREVFDGEEGVTLRAGSMLDARVDAWVTPTNARAQMNGGLDGAIRQRLGASIQARVRRAIAASWGDAMPLGVATCVPTGHAAPSFLVSTPTMHGPSEDISATLHVALACAAALQAVRIQNRAAPGSIRSVAMPGLGAGTGHVAPAVCAELMWTAWHLFEERHFESFHDVREALRAELGELTPDAAPAHYREAPRYAGVRPATLPRPFHGHARAIA